MEYRSANLADALEYAQSDVQLSALSAQIGGGMAWVTDFALFGLYILEPANRKSDLEAWFVCSSACSARMISHLRVMRGLLYLYKKHRIRAAIRPGHRPGERMARICGFEPTDEYFHAPGTPVDGVRYWRFNHE
jgi:hypothetical protein